MTEQMDSRKKCTTPAGRLLVLQLLALASILLSLWKGSSSVSLPSLLYNDYGQFQTIFIHLRLPRTLSAFTAGGLLALSGACMQLLLQNPLADPYVLGISSGAAFFTLLLMLLGIQGDWLLLGAWSGSLLSAGFVLLLASHYRWQIHQLLLIGIATAGGFASGISLILLLSPDHHLHSMLFWLSGDLNDATMPTVSMLILLGGLLLCWLLAPAFDVLGRGEKEAQLLGLPVQAYRRLVFLIASLAAAAAVTTAGCLGFVGLIVPHYARRLFGYQHQLMLPAAVLLGGTVVVIADVGARWLFAPEQIPVGLIITLTGIPIFISLLRT